MVGDTREIYAAIPRDRLEKIDRIARDEIPLYCKNLEAANVRHKRVGRLGPLRTRSMELLQEMPALNQDLSNELTYRLLALALALAIRLFASGLIVRGSCRGPLLLRCSFVLAQGLFPQKVFSVSMRAPDSPRASKRPRDS